MYVLVTPEGAALREASDTRALSVVSRVGMNPARLQGALAAAALGRFDGPGGYAWLIIAALRERALDGGCPQADFEAMIAYADSHGWVTRGEVRAHVEHTTAAGDFVAASPEQRSRWWRNVLGEYPTGVSIISALDAAGKPQGLVVGTFSSVSQDPPLVSFMPMRASRSYTAIANCSSFRVSVLGAGHEDLCRAFASAPPESRFEIGNWSFDANGVPRLDDAVVWFDCVRLSTIPAGDHDIVLGEVHDLGFGNGAAGMPMLFLKGGYGSFTLQRLEFDAEHLGSYLRVAEEMRPKVETLAVEIKATVLLCSLAQDKVVVLSAANLTSRGTRPQAVGSTFPFAAPMGVVFAAWNGDGLRPAMWRKAGRALGFSDDEILSQMIQRVRQRGYAISVGPAMAEQFEYIVSNPAKGDADLQELWAAIAREYADLGETPEWAAHVSSIQVPIFGPDGEPGLALAVSGLPAGLSPDQLDEIADRCKAVAGELSTMITGRLPRQPELPAPASAGRGGTLRSLEVPP